MVTDCNQSGSSVIYWFSWKSVPTTPPKADSSILLGLVCSRIRLYFLIVISLLDGSIDPPHFYYSHIIATLQAHGHEVPTHFVINHACPIGHNSTVPMPLPPPTSAATITATDNAVAQYASFSMHFASTSVEQMNVAANATSASQNILLLLSLHF